MTASIKKVGSVSVQAGRWTRGKLKVGLYPDGRNAFIPLLTAGSKTKGPVGLLITGAHGNEINGPEVVERVLSALDLSKLRGTLIVLPIMNPWGFAERSRFVSIDQRDLNRSYPGHRKGSFTFQVAWTIMHEVVKLADFVIDVHDAGERQIMLPHSRIHAEPKYDPTRAIGLAFGSDVVLVRDAEPGMLAREARAEFGTPVISLEIGGAMRIWEDYQQRAVHGVLNILRSQGMLPGKLEMPAQQLLLNKREGSAAELTGIQSTWPSIGHVVKPGDPLYQIYNPLTGEKFVHRARTCGVVLSNNILGRVDKGMEAIATLNFTGCGEEALTRGDIIRNRAGSNVRIVSTGLEWRHPAHE
jgi:predicted deacylase